ncbi:MAG: TAXI family TRAP transporter solute-binding subunit [Candidatus Cloacimonadota bacterium]|nr:TAXI family TRAP transporter solute-binding subunit [Candidatus Cloacimonadota bacterium]
MKKIVYFIVLLIFFQILSGCGKQNTKFVTIGTGGVTGVYYPTGGAISRMVNKKRAEYGIKATVESTGGSVYNINAVLDGDLDFGIAQSDRQYQAYEGLAEWKKMGPQTELRSVFSIHPESITLVATQKSNINTVSDLKGKTVNIGNPGSGQLQNSRDILSSFVIDENDDIYAEHVKAVEAPGLMQDERIDAFFYTVGHPSGNIKEATSGRIKVKLIPIQGKNIDSLLQEKSYYDYSLIQKKHYPYATNENDISTIGVKATLITSKSTPNDIVYAITKEVFDNFNDFKSLHPAYETLTKERMLKGLSAPIHPGALIYYRENDLIKYIDPELIIKTN